MNHFLCVIALFIIIQPLAAQKTSYDSNVENIENIKASYRGCIVGPCYSWWSIALKKENELLKQHGGHYPASRGSRHFSIGTWAITGDTLKLNITSDFLDTTYMRPRYRMIEMNYCELLLPISEHENWDVFFKDVQQKFEENEGIQDFPELGQDEKFVSKRFNEFVRFKYSADKKILIRPLK